MLSAGKQVNANEGIRCEDQSWNKVNQSEFLKEFSCLIQVLPACSGLNDISHSNDYVIVWLKMFETKNGSQHALNENKIKTHKIWN